MAAEGLSVCFFGAIGGKVEVKAIFAVPGVVVAAASEMGRVEAANEEGRLEAVAAAAAVAEVEVEVDAAEIWVRLAHFETRPRPRRWRGETPERRSERKRGTPPVPWYFTMTDDLKLRGRFVPRKSAVSHLQTVAGGGGPESDLLRPPKPKPFGQRPPPEREKILPSK